MSTPGSTVPSSEYHAALDRRDRREDKLLARIAKLERFAQWALATSYGGHDPQLALSRIADEARKAIKD